MIELAPLERAAAGRTPERAALAFAALQALERGELFAAGVQPQEGFARLARTLAAVFGDPALMLSDGERWTLAFYGSLLNSLFAAAGVWPEAAALFTLDSPHAGPVAPEFAQALGLIATSPVLTARGADRRERLLWDAEGLEGQPLPGGLAAVTLASAAWMSCSYAAGPEKHALKPVLNRAFRRLLDELGLRDLPPPQAEARPERPTLLVMAEVIHAAHVQYRYFGQYLRQLRTRFRLVLVAPRKELGAAVEALFDEVFAFDPAAVDFAPEVLRFVGATAPDIVFWPSVGMARWGPLLANLRLAPLQMTALGHSASTFIPAIDYYLTEEGYVSDPGLFSERLLLLPDATLRFERPPGYARVAPQIRETADPVRIAVPSNVLKLNPAFLQMLGRVRREAGRPVQLHLFPNAPLLTVSSLRAAAGPLLEGAVVYPRLSPQAYLEALNACDMVLSPWPFGGLHSVVDALRQGLPVVAMDRPEPHGRTDAMILRRLGMPDWLVARTEDEYLGAALRLIGDDAVRLEASRAALARDVDRVMFGDAETPLGSDVVDLVWAVFCRHEAIQADGRRAWRLADLATLP
ncbi:hypothetical protein [Phenylobacterium sp.]|uniref:hypothetical protein n=1 Tax=Phenylobacterium sp. TaxID=1871053 RepID=UPI002CCE7EA4|nr:hypothetical protein [Phenylobacterium sp.]HVI34500.1 hypothetical protein [Phenylobacterium sp.]